MDPLRPGIGETGFVAPSETVDTAAADPNADVKAPIASTSVAGASPAGAALRAGIGLSASDIDALAHVAQRLGGQRAALLTGAGLSTDSGIPDYRGPDSPPRQPLSYQEFMGDPALRQRYWARNHLGWAHLQRAVPNAGHRAAAALERGGQLTGIVTQNVDRLHEVAGAERVVDLHGRFDQVLCTNCNTQYSRQFLATVLTELNPGFVETVEAAGGAGMAPDADAALESEQLIGQFRIAICPLCGGLLKPDFVFFGENVPKARVEAAYAMVDAAELLVVAGSSLTVLSGLRFVKKAAKDGKDVVIINRGETRGDALASLKLTAGVTESLGFLADALNLDWRKR